MYIIRVEERLHRRGWAADLHVYSEFGPFITEVMFVKRQFESVPAR